ncbi:MAG TPA: extracellular solute-binding protein [Aggregatilineales bacterium]|nr:extracellular solute-binding protein [Anaerolineales bacterium]HRE46188.1 extracellular solute-binding protein [Aggregatilineales bacterium]
MIPFSRRLLLILTAISLTMVAVGVTARPAFAQRLVRVWYTLSDEALIGAWIGAYETAREGRVKIEARPVQLHQMEALLLSETTLPDALIAPSDLAGRLIHARLLTQLDIKIVPDFRAQIIPSAWETVSYDARTVGIPLLMEGTLLFYNRALVTGDLPTTDDALFAAAKTYEAGGKIGLALTLGVYPTAGIYNAFGGIIINDSGVNQLSVGTAFRDYLSYLRALRGAAGIALNGGREGFKAGNTAFALDSSWTLGNYAAALGDRLGVLALPTVKGAIWRPFVRTQALYVRLGAVQGDAALDFARFITEQDAQSLAAKAGAIPVNPVVGKDDPLLAAIHAQFEQGISLPNRYEMSAYWAPLADAVSDAYFGDDPLPAILARTIRAVDDRLLHLPR